MLLDVNTLRGSRARVERTLQPSAFEPQDPEYRVVAPVELSMEIQRTGRDALGVTGQVVTRLELACSRCLEPFDVPVDSRFELRYVPLSENAGDEEREVGDDELTTAYYREGMLDLIELMREQFVLALPMKPLCSETCLGLCPECGTNLNTTPCGCSRTWEDPRLAPLRSLLPRDKES